MRSINAVVISGNLGRDPEVRTTAGGTELMELRVAVTDNVKQGEQWTKRTHWVQCTMFGRSVSFWSSQLRKGSFVVVQGRLDYREWEKDGIKRSALSVVADEINNGPRQSGQRSEPKDEPVDDIPF